MRFYGEAFSAAAFFSHVGVIEAKSGAQTFRNKVDYRAIEKIQIVMRNNDLDAIFFENNVI